MSMRKQDYPPDWTAISLAVRERAGQKCEWCGAPNLSYVLRLNPTLLKAWKTVKIGDVEKYVPYGDFLVMAPKAQGSTRIILTVAHLDRDRQNNDLANLAALCQRCHLNHDRAAQHIPHRKYDRYHDREQQGKFDL